MVNGEPWLEPKGVPIAVAKSTAPNRRLVKARGWNPVTGVAPIPTPLPALPTISLPQFDPGGTASTVVTSAGLTGTLYGLGQACNNLLQGGSRVPGLSIRSALMASYGSGGPAPLNNVVE
ncbi:MAG: hypothetical protein GY943_23535 [Chloroflexi bacterium]|nr:hypothetical protein [Chloroflexota bacterium]